MKRQSRRNVLRAVAVVAVSAAAASVLCKFAQAAPAGQVVVYCAHDAGYAEDILKQFEKRTGILVRVKYDTEATKSLGLVEMILREKEAPRCDLFWNNQTWGTQRLADAGVLQPYKGSGWERIPAEHKDPAGLWTGFAARLRVYIVNTKKMPADKQKVKEALAGADLSRVAIAKPLYGTTFTHYVVLRKLWGEEKLKAWHADCRARKISEVGGNAQVKNVVANGICDLGFTDSDDYFIAQDEGKPVALLPIRLDDGKTICIPNSIALVKGAKNAEAAQKLADYLLSAECEMALAKSASRQIPLGPVDDAALPAEVKQMKAWAAESCSMAGMSQDAEAVLAWLKAVYAP